MNCGLFEFFLGIEFIVAFIFLLICLSVFMVMVYVACVERDRKNTLKWLGFIIIGGVFFLVG